MYIKPYIKADVEYVYKIHNIKNCDYKCGYDKVLHDLLVSNDDLTIYFYNYFCSFTNYKINCFNLLPFLNQFNNTFQNDKHPDYYNYYRLFDTRIKPINEARNEYLKHKVRLNWAGTNKIENNYHKRVYFPLNDFVDKKLKFHVDNVDEFYYHVLDIRSTLYNKVDFFNKIPTYSEKDTQLLNEILHKR